MPIEMRKLVLVIFALGATSLYLGFAVWGEGGLRPFFAQPALIVLAAMTLFMAAAAPFTAGNLSSGEKEDRGNRWVLAIFNLLGPITGFVPAWSDRAGFWVIDGETTRWLGIALYVVGSVLRMVPVLVLGRRFSGLVAIQPDHQLVTTGIYAKVRNPSYVGLLVQTIGWGLAFRSWFGALIALVMLGPLIARMGSEERLLGEHFGARYAAYKARTWRLIPWLY